MPSILVTTPAFPPLLLDPPEYEEVIVAPDSFQNVIGLAALGFGVLCPILAVIGVILGLTGVGNTLANTLIVGLGFLMGAIFFGV